jgi:diphosphomevalonate decarboxylase
VVFITQREYAPAVTAAIADLGLGLETVTAPIGGPAYLISVEEALAEL